MIRDVSRDIIRNLQKQNEEEGANNNEKQPEDMWRSFKSAMIKPCRKYLSKRQDWMKDEILGLMEERRIAKISRN